MDLQERHERLLYPVVRVFAETAKEVAQPAKEIPNASERQAIVFAVYIP